LANHESEPVPEDVDKEISRILRRAEAELLNWANINGREDMRIL